MSQTHHKLVRSRHKMMAEDALLYHPEAVRVPGTMEIRDLPETPEEVMMNTTGGRSRYVPE